VQWSSAFWAAPFLSVAKMVNLGFVSVAKMVDQGVEILQVLK
jgi:hypothetical protein